MIRRAAILLAILTLATAALAQSATPPVELWQGQRALGDIAQQLTFGVRALDTPGHAKTIAYIEAQLRQAGAVVTEQRWTSNLGGRTHALVNIVGRFFPEKPRRIILGTHYDSIIRAYRDKHHPDAPMPGANNSASGVALLLETARALKAAPTAPPYGIDLVFFDGEEGPLSLGDGDKHWQPLGSPYFAAHLAALYPDALPVKAAIFDMVCWRKEKLRPEPVSLRYAGEETERFWKIGTALAPRIFSTEPVEAPIYDDQLALNEARIPAFLVIGFDYEPWFNTTHDTLDKCSEAAMSAVGHTLIRYIYTR
jgi:Peptidase family M28